MSCCAVVALVGAAGSSDGASVERCHTSELSLRLVKDGAGGGTSFYHVTLRNKSAHSCTVKGYPGVSLLGANKHQIGRSAKRRRGTAHVRLITLRPHAAAASKFTVSVGACSGKPPVSRFLRVIPPDETDSLIVRARVAACAPAVYPLLRSTKAARATSRCHSGSLRLSVKKFNGAAGTEFLLVVLRNRGSHSCTLHGYPGVSLLDRHRHQVGPSAKRAKGRSPKFTVRPRHAGSAKFTMRLCSRTGRYLRAFPPAERRALVTRVGLQGCKPVVYPLQPGTKPPNQHR